MFIGQRDALSFFSYLAVLLFNIEIYSVLPQYYVFMYMFPFALIISGVVMFYRARKNALESDRAL